MSAAKTKRWTMTDIVAANKTAGLFWFSPDTMSFFQTRLFPDTVRQGPGGIYFVTSERMSFAVPRRYSVRVFDPADATVRTVGEFCRISTKAAAVKLASAHAKATPN